MTMHLHRITTLCCLALAAGMVSCTKEDLPEAGAPQIMETTRAEPVDFIPVSAGCDAVLVAIADYDFSSSGGGVPAVAGLARAVFPSGLGNYLAVGDVQSQDVSLALEPGNTYSLSPSPGLPGGLNFVTAPSYRWSVEGNAQFPAMNFICATGFPVISEMVLGTPTIDRTADFTFGTTLPIDDADSVRFWLFAPNGYLYAAKSGSQYTHTFDKGKLSLLTAGPAYVRITAYNAVFINLAGKTVQYVNEAVTTMPVEIR